MTKAQAFKKARALWGEKGAVKIEERSAYIGQHGEYVTLHAVISTKKESPKAGRYRCSTCSTITEEGGDVIDRAVWHKPGSLQRRYAVGFVALGMFFHLKGEGASFEEAFANVGK